MPAKKMVKKHKIAVALAIVTVIAIFFFFGPYYCSRIFAAQISYNGKPSVDSRLYRIRDGEFILMLNEHSEGSPYWIVPQKEKIYVANRSNFSFSEWIAFARHNDQYGVDLSYTAKTDIEPKIIAGNNFIEFTSMERQRVRVSW